MLLLLLMMVIIFIAGVIIGHSLNSVKLHARLDELEYVDIAIIRRLFLFYKLPLEITVSAKKLKEACENKNE